MSLRYRPEIDGLRALAIGSVLIYHLKLEVGDLVLLQGGFLGVDVFFVISGYLITGVILTELAQTGRFSYATFYERRARRLLPALLTVLMASSLAAWFILLPDDMVEFARSALASIFFASNIYWDLASQQYGATSGLLQPLLHTWSLAVEEQFYLIFPVFLLAGLRWFPDRILPICLALIAANLVLAEVLTRINFLFSFYWLVSRVWEMLAGATLALGMQHKARRPVSGPARALPLVGLSLIVASMVTVPVSFHHPGFGTIAAVLGTVLIIGFAHPTEPVTRLLSSRALVAVGLISYSLYLWHYPVYVFGRHLRGEPGMADHVVWLVISFGLATLTYHFVEQPFRNRQTVTLPWLGGGLAAATALVTMFAVAMLATDGLRARFPELIALYGRNDFSNDALAVKSWGVLEARARAHGLPGSDPRYPSVFERSVLWFDPGGATPRVLLVGDSHTKDMFNVLDAAARQTGGFQVARFALPLRDRDRWIGALLSSPNFAAADTIALSYRWFDEMLPWAEEVIAALRAKGKDVVLLSNTVEYPEPRGQTLFDEQVRVQGGLAPDAMNQAAWDRRDLARVEPVNRALRNLAERLGIPFYDKEDFMCDRAAHRCALVTPDGFKTPYDYGHYTLEGAQYFGARVAELGWFTR